MILCWRRPQQALEAAMKELSKTSQLSAFPKKNMKQFLSPGSFWKKNILKCRIHLPPSNKLHPYKPFICSTSSWRPVINHPTKKTFSASWWRGFTPTELARQFSEKSEAQWAEDTRAAGCWLTWWGLPSLLGCVVVSMGNLGRIPPLECVGFCEKCIL